MIKPRIYWTYYPKLKRGFWRVSLCPSRNSVMLDLWHYANNIASEMNKALDKR